jgi:hypothetical protein
MIKRSLSTRRDEAPARDDPAFGMWRDREDMADVAAYTRRIRAPRFKRDGSRDKPIDAEAGT